LLKTSTSLVAGKKGDELAASVSTAMLIAVVIGTLQTLSFLCFGNQILSIMRLPMNSDMRAPALAYLKWRAPGVPAATLLLVAIGTLLFQLY
jgi:Na+-driven multidrug efflux pump